MASIVLIAVGVVVALVPLTVYLAWLGLLNRRERPCVVPGAWDVVALFAGLSGFVLVGGTLLLGGVQSNARVLLRGNNKQALGMVAAERTVWAVAGAGYLLGVGGLVGVAVLGRGRSIAVYNLGREQATRALESALDDLGLKAERHGDLWASAAVEVAELQVFNGFRHVTVWLLHPDARRRQELERAVRRKIDTELSGDNPAASWIGSATGGLTITVLAFFGLLAYIFALSR